MHGHAYVVTAGCSTDDIYHSVATLEARIFEIIRPKLLLHRTQVCMAMHTRKSLITLNLTLEWTTEFIEHRVDRGLLRFQVCMAMNTWMWTAPTELSERATARFRWRASRKSITVKLTVKGTTESVEHRVDRGLLRF